MPGACHFFSVLNKYEFSRESLRSCSDVMEGSVVLTDFIALPSIKFHENLSSGNRTVLC